MKGAIRNYFVERGQEFAFYSEEILGSFKHGTETVLTPKWKRDCRRIRWRQRNY